MTQLSIAYDAPSPYSGPKAQNYNYATAPQLPPELDASVHFTLPSLLAAHGVQIVPYAPGMPVLEIFFTKLVRVCTGGMACANSSHVRAQLSGAEGQTLWSHEAWVDDDAYDSPGQKEMFRRLVTDMSRDKVIPATAKVPERSFVVVTAAPGTTINVRSYAVRFSRSGMGEDFKLTSDRTLRESLVLKEDWHIAALLPDGAEKAAAATHSVVKNVTNYPAGQTPGCDNGAHGNPALVNADVAAVLKKLTAESGASYGLFISSRIPPGEDGESPLNDTGLFIADSVDDSGLMKFDSTPRGASHRESNLITPYCAVFYDAAADAAIFQTWRPTRPVSVPSKYYDHLDGIGEGLLPSLAREFDANLSTSLDKTLPTFIEQMTP